MDLRIEGAIFVFLTKKMKQSYSKSEKLKGEKLLDALFSQGRSVTAYPLRLIFIPADFSDKVLVKTGVSVPKRQFKRAVDRIRIKRLIREAYRLNKPIIFNNITTQYAFMILYIGNEKPSFAEIESALKTLFKKFLDQHSNQHEKGND